MEQVTYVFKAVRKGVKVYKNGKFLFKASSQLEAIKKIIERENS